MSDATHPGTLVACIGNIFLGDDGFGCAVARELARIHAPAQAKIVDYGIRGLDLAYALLEPYETAIFVDAVSRGDTPGTVYLLQPVGLDAKEDIGIDPHSMDPLHLLAMARSLGEVTAEIFIVGCEPLDFGDELEGRMGLSEAVAFAVPEAARAVVDLIRRKHSRDRQQTAASVCALS